VEPTTVNELPDGAIVAARLEEKSGYYRFVRNGSAIRLHSITGRGEGTQVEDSDSLILHGRVTGMYRRMDQLPVAATAIAH
jgi:hypothetical protein